MTELVRSEDLSQAKHLASTPASEERTVWGPRLECATCPTLPNRCHHDCYLPSRDQVWSYHTKELHGGNDLGVLPELRKMAWIARDQIVGASSVGALNEDVVVGIGGNARQR